jgi:hypothetical protein
MFILKIHRDEECLILVLEILTEEAGADEVAGNTGKEEVGSEG